MSESKYSRFIHWVSITVDLSTSTTLSAAEANVRVKINERSAPRPSSGNGAIRMLGAREVTEYLQSVVNKNLEAMQTQLDFQREEERRRLEEAQRAAEQWLGQQQESQGGRSNEAEFGG